MEKYKEVFTDNLPRKDKQRIDWIKSAKLKCIVNFAYEDLKGKIQIVGYDLKNKKIFVKYKNNNPYPISPTHFYNGNIGGILKEDVYTHEYDGNKSRRIDLRELPVNERGIDWNKVAKNKMKICFVYDDIEGIITILNYNQHAQEIIIKYLDKEPYKIKTSGFLNCQLGELLNKHTENFKIEIGQVFKDKKRDLTIIDRKIIKDESGHNWKIYKYKCNKCGFDCGEHYKNGEYKKEYWIVESNLLSGKGCTCCCSNPHVTVPGINDIPTTAPWMVKYFQGGYNEAKLYTKRSSQKIYPICPDCGRVKDKLIIIDRIYKYHSINCICGDKLPYPEKFMSNILQQLLGSDFIYQLTKTNLKWCNNYRYDFYFKINNEEYIIETHGRQHYKESSSFFMTLKEEQENDRHKKELAIKNGIKKENYIVIDCRKSELEWIKNNLLQSKINNIFDLSKVDWLKSHKYACSSLVKKAWNLWNSGIHSTAKIGKILNLNRHTIIEYLKRGNELKWCDYNPKEERRKGHIRSVETNSKPVEIFNLKNQSLGIFKSISELIRQFGINNIKLTGSNISLVLTGKRKSYKGYIFRYINKDNYCM